MLRLLHLTGARTNTMTNTLGSNNRGVELAAVLEGFSLPAAARTSTGRRMPTTRWHHRLSGMTTTGRRPMTTQRSIVTKVTAYKHFYYSQSAGFVAQLRTCACRLSLFEHMGTHSERVRAAPSDGFLLWWFLVRMQQHLRRDGHISQSADLLAWVIECGQLNAALERQTLLA